MNPPEGMAAGALRLDSELLAILVCPVKTCHAELEQRGDRLVCERCGLQYPIERHWPVLIPELAQPSRES